MEERRSRPPEQLRLAADTLFYEAWMVEQSANWLSGSGMSQAARNMAAEAFLIHVRAIISFFYDESSRADDMSYRDFAACAGEWKLSPEAACLKELRSSISKHVAHMTYLRRTRLGKKASYDIAQVQSEILDLCESFFRALPAGILVERGRFERSSASVQRSTQAPQDVNCTTRLD